MSITASDEAFLAAPIDTAPPAPTADTAGFTGVDPSANPGLAQSLANQAMSGGEEQPVIAPRPPKDVFELPGGFVNRDGKLLKEVRVRELNGYDEEELARPSIQTVMDFVDLIVKRNTVSIGGVKPETNHLDELLIGDRDAIVLAVRAATYGTSFKMPVLCPNCGENFEVEVDIEKDIPVKELPGDATQRTRSFVLETGKYAGKTVMVNLMNGSAQRVAYNNEMNNGMQTSLMLNECIYSIGDTLYHDIAQAKELDSSTRREIGNFLNENTCGPQWQGVMQACPNCQVETPLPITLVAMFRE